MHIINSTLSRALAGGRCTVAIILPLAADCLAVEASLKVSCCGHRGMDIASDIIEGIAYLHAAGIVHFDLKSPNILLFDNWGGGYRAKVADVGLARMLGSKTHLSQTMPGGMSTSLPSQSVWTSYGSCLRWIPACRW